ncbi:hypothetical protein [Clostridium polynesiense]|uniref:hypothetical protein n=1 Tax=Clostridium polynesiense TaxID=1325933 RepID=UPI00058E6872|nr:hypothetical protein [Clostridium polynesiense]
MKKSRFNILLIIGLVIFILMRFAPLFAPSTSSCALGKNSNIDIISSYEEISTEVFIRTLRDKEGTSYLTFSFLLFIIAKNLIRRIYIFFRYRNYIIDIRFYFKRFIVMYFNGSRYKDHTSFSV